MLQKENCLYQPYYCEENIWQLCKHDYFKNSEVEVLFLLPSQAKCIAVWHQKLSEDNNPVLWDYHVVLYHKKANLIFDFDSELNFPADAISYFQHSFSTIYPIYLPTFRLFQKKDFESYFYSNREHMKNEAGQWIEPPPKWEMPGIDLTHYEKRISLTDILNSNNESIGKTYSFIEMLDYIRN